MSCNNMRLLEPNQISYTQSTCTMVAKRCPHISGKRSYPYVKKSFKTQRSRIQIHPVIWAAIGQQNIIQNADTRVWSNAHGDQRLNQFESVLLFFFPVPCARLFSLKNQKNFLTWIFNFAGFTESQHPPPPPPTTKQFRFGHNTGYFLSLETTSLLSWTKFRQSEICIFKKNLKK